MQDVHTQSPSLIIPLTVWTYHDLRRREHRHFFTRVLQFHVHLQPVHGVVLLRVAEVTGVPLWLGLRDGSLRLLPLEDVDGVTLDLLAVLVLTLDHGRLRIVDIDLGGLSRALLSVHNCGMHLQPSVSEGFARPRAALGALDSCRRRLCCRLRGRTSIRVDLGLSRGRRLINAPGLTSGLILMRSL